MREPQWNVNANQIAYVVRGTVLVSMLANADEFASFVVQPGQMYHVASGAIYHIARWSLGAARSDAATPAPREPATEVTEPRRRPS